MADLESFGGLDSQINESDCCGNGCANCILNVKPKISKHCFETGKKNILSNYSKFKLIDKSKYDQLTNVLQLHFVSQWKNQRKETNTADSDEFILDIPPGHHIMMRAQITNNETSTMVRPYSPYWSDAIQMEFKILVNLKPNGPMSKYIGFLQLGEEVEFRGPIGTFEHKPTNALTEQDVLIFSQGVAIAPTIPIIEEILNNDDDYSRVQHFACFQDLDNIIFRNELHNYNRYWNFKSRIYLSRQKCDDGHCRHHGCCSQFRNALKYKELIFPHRLTEENLNQVLGELQCDQQNFIICGSTEFQKFIIEIVKSSKSLVKNYNIFAL